MSITGTIRLCPWECHKLGDVTPEGYTATLIATPPSDDSEYGELIAALGPAEDDSGRVYAAHEARLRESGRLSCEDTLMWQRTGCSEVTITYTTPTDCNWYKTVLHMARPPFWTPFGTPGWNLVILSDDPTVVHPGEESGIMRGREITLVHSTVQMIPGTWLVADEHFTVGMAGGDILTKRSAQIAQFGTPTLTGGYVTEVVDEVKRLYKVVVFGEESTVKAGDWRKWHQGITLNSFVLLGPNCFTTDEGESRDCPQTEDICTEGGDFNAFGPDDILRSLNYIILPISVEGVNPIGPAIRTYGRNDLGALLDAQVVLGVVKSRDLENDTADIDLSGGD